jgi:hypothetical protein
MVKFQWLHYFPRIANWEWCASLGLDAWTMEICFVELAKQSKSYRSTVGMPHLAGWLTAWGAN